MEIGHLLDLDLAVLEVDDLRRVLDQVVAVGRRVDAERLRLLAELDRRNAWKADGAGSMADWAAKTTGASRKRARREADTAAKLADMPRVGDALCAGVLSGEQAAALASGLDGSDATKEAFRRDEPELVDRAAAMAPEQIAKMMGRWRRQHRPECEAEDHAARVARRSGRLGDSDDGSMRTFWLESDPASAQLWRPVLEEVAEWLYLQDTEAIRAANAAGDRPPGLRSYPQRLHDAFVYLVTHGAGGYAAARGVPVPRFVVVVREDTWGRFRAETTDGTPLPTDLVNEVGLSAEIIRSVVDAQGRVIDWGFKRRTATGTQRDILELLWGGCVVADCQVGMNGCEMHHVDPYDPAAGTGPTDLDNLVPACTINGHHAQLTAGQLHLHRNPDTSIDTRTPDGRHLGRRRPHTTTGHPHHPPPGPAPPPAPRSQPTRRPPPPGDDPDDPAHRPEPRQLTLDGPP